MFLSCCHLSLKNAKWVILATGFLHVMLYKKQADTYILNGYADFEVEGGDMAKGAWRNEFDTTLLKPTVSDKSCINPKKRAADIGEIFTNSKGRNCCNVEMNSSHQYLA